MFSAPGCLRLRDVFSSGMSSDSPNELLNRAAKLVLRKLHSVEFCGNNTALADQLSPNDMDATRRVNTNPTKEKLMEWITVQLLAFQVPSWVDIWLLLRGRRRWVGCGLQWALRLEWWWSLVCGNCWDHCASPTDGYHLRTKTSWPNRLTCTCIWWRTGQERLRPEELLWWWQSQLETWSEGRNNQVRPDAEWWEICF